MTTLNRWASATFAASLVTTAAAHSSPFQPSLLAFGDLYYIPQHHLEEADDDAGVWLRRLYLTLDIEPEDSPWEIRLRTESNGPDVLDDHWTHQWKDVYASYNFGRHKVTAGKQPSLTFNTLENFWGYRALARTPPDMQGMSSRFTGVSLKGRLLADEQLRYALVTAVGDDSNQQPVYQATLGWHSPKGWLLELYADETEREDKAYDMQSWQLFGSYGSGNWRLGAHYTRRDRDNYRDPQPDDVDTEIELLAGFYIYDFQNFDLIVAMERLLEPSTKGDGIRYVPMSPDAKATILQLGLDYEVKPWLHLIPNIWFTNYDSVEESGVAQPEDDLYLRLTFELKL